MPARIEVEFINSAVVFLVYRIIGTNHEQLHCMLSLMGNLLCQV